MLKSMTLPEKTAWIMCLALAVAGWLYIAPIITSIMDGLAAPVPGRSAIGFVVLIVIIAIIGHIIVAVTDPETANQRMDERDWSVAHRAGHWSGVVFGVLTITALLAYLVLRDGDLLFHMIFASMILSQMFEYGLVILSYRRGY